MTRVVKPIKNNIGGIIKPPIDKSIAHRALILGSIAKGKSTIKNFSTGHDVVSTFRCLLRLGVEFKVGEDDADLTILGKGLYGLKEPIEELDCRNSGTTMRLLAGILAAQRFDSVLTGDFSLKKRPMERVITPLTQMGAKIMAKGGKAPLLITGRRLKRTSYHVPVQSAQVKSCLQLARLYAIGDASDCLTGAEHTRNHTEVMIEAMTENGVLTGRDFMIPGDISSGMFFIVLGILHSESSISVAPVGLNRTRIKALEILHSAGAKIIIDDLFDTNGEPVGGVIAFKSSLKAFNIDADQAAMVIDEIPILAVAAAFAEGQSVFSGLEELRHKESDRIHTIVSELSKLGIDITDDDDTLIINGNGGERLEIKPGIKLNSHNDHRIAMACAVAATQATKEVFIENADCVEVSYPDFFKDLENV